VSWAAIPDLCVEPELAPTPELVRTRQEQTTLAMARFVAWYRHVPYAWVPTIQRDTRSMSTCGTAAICAC
jgi:hypothetical protein